MTAYYVGAGAGGLIPSFLALIQGANSVSCASATVRNNTSLSSTPADREPTVHYLFSVGVYMAAITFTMLISTIAFVLTHRYFGNNENYVRLEQTEKSASDNDEERLVEPINNSDRVVDHTAKCRAKCMSEPCIILLLIAIASFLFNGFMPSLQTFSVLPYGQTTYYVTVCLGACVEPLSSFAAFFYPAKRLRTCLAIGAVGATSAVFLVVLASMSPTPPLHGNVGGSIMTCTFWAIFTGTISYVRPNLAMLINDKMKSGLFWCGVLTQCGACIGALLSFILVSVLRLFVSASPC